MSKREVAAYLGVAAGYWLVEHGRGFDYAVEYADKLIAAGQGAIARTMLEKAAPLLGYYADTTAADEPGTSEADMNNRLERLDKIMAKCGASRPPRPAR